jgi:hypothetical protein
MHVEWGSIKQRPHFIAEGLSQHFDVDVFFFPNYAKTGDIENPTHLLLRKLFRLPLLRFALMNQLNTFCFRLFFSFLVKKYDVIYITIPSFISFFPENTCKNKTLIYDCMDDNIAMEKNYRQQMFDAEKELVLRANLFITTSAHLKKVVNARYATNREIHIINNALNKNKLHNILKTSFFDNSFYNLSYIGSVSSWFDIDTMLFCLKQHPDICLHLFGVLDIPLPQHPRIIYHGVIEHDLVFSVMNDSDGLIMPFILNDIVLSVNPVKAYEYIASGKPVFMVRYDETLPFDHYVYLYNTHEELSALLQSRPANKAEKNEINAFLLNNCWEKRVDTIVSLLHEPNNEVVL